VGEAVGVKTGGGLLEQSLRSLEVECLPKDLPDIIRVDVSHLGLGSALHVSDLPALPGVKYLLDGEVTVFLVSEPKVSDEAGATEGAPTEPEVINEKKTEEGAAKDEAKKE
jgi:large subunit ribosomal protein L25